MTDPKVRPPKRITVSGGPKAEPHLYQAHPAEPEPVRFPTWYEVIAAVAIIFLLIVIFLSFDSGVR
jgi:hypothetical protein